MVVRRQDVLGDACRRACPAASGAYYLAGMLLSVAVAALPLACAPRVAYGARLGLVFGLIAALALVDLSAPANRSRAIGKRLTPADCRARRLAAATGIALLVHLWLALVAPGGGAAHGLATLAAALAALGGIALRAAAIRALGERFITDVSPGRAPAGRPRAAAPALIQSGVYARLRHPSELGLLVFVFGVAGVARSGAACAFAACVIVPLVVARLRLEEAELSAAFGDRYDRYRRRTGALLPRTRLCRAAAL